MKQFFKKALLPLAVFVVAVVSTFAMNTTSASVAPELTQPLYTGPFCYLHPTTGDCINIVLNPVTTNCTLINTGITCTVTIPVLGNVLLRACIQYPQNSGIWICVAPLYRRTK